MTTFKDFFNAGTPGSMGITRKRHHGALLNTRRPHEPVPDMHKSKKDVDKFRSLKGKMTGKYNITNNEAEELKTRFNVKFSQSNVATLGNTGITLYKNPNGEGYILQK